MITILSVSISFLIYVVIGTGWAASQAVRMQRVITHVRGKYERERRARAERKRDPLWDMFPDPVDYGSFRPMGPWFSSGRSWKNDLRVSLFLHMVFWPVLMVLGGGIWIIDHVVSAPLLWRDRKVAQLTERRALWMDIRAHSTVSRAEAEIYTRWITDLDDKIKRLQP